MSDDLENIVRQWGRSGAGPEAPSPPTDRCVTFEQAHALARGDGGDDQAALREHVERCDRCQRLVASFREAMAEGPPAELGASAQAATARPARGPGRLIRWLVPAAAAALVLLAVGAAILQTGRPKTIGPLLAEAEVGLADDVLNDVRLKGAPAFVTGDAVMFRVRLARAGHVMLIRIDPAGAMSLLTPMPAETDAASVAVPEGPAKLGPCSLTGPGGTETFLIVATDEPVKDLPRRFATLQDAGGGQVDVESRVRQVSAWPADVRVVPLEHVAPPAR